MHSVGLIVLRERRPQLRRCRVCDRITVLAPLDADKGGKHGRGFSITRFRCPLCGATGGVYDFPNARRMYYGNPDD